MTQLETSPAEGRGNPSIAPASIKDIVLVAAASAAALFVAGKILLYSLHLVAPYRPDAQMRGWLLAAFSALLDAAHVGIVLWGMGRLNVGSEIFHRRSWLKALFLGILVGVVAKFTFKWGDPHFFVVWPDLLAKPYRAFGTVVFAPVVESVFFCGVLYTAARRGHPPAAAFGICALAFGLTEFALRLTPVGPGLGYPVGYVSAFLGAKLVLGAVFAATYAATGSLLAPILAHAVYNL